MEQPKPPYTSFNKWFLIPFFLWVILGGIALLLFDRQYLFGSINTRHTLLLDVLMVWITKMGEGVFGAIILLALLLMKSFRNGWYFAAALVCNVVPALIVQAVKSSVDAPRPLNYFKEAAWIHTLPEWERLMERSFPSGHTAAAFCLFAFLSLILTPKYKWLGVVFFILAMLVGYSRIYLAAHFFHDVYFGSVFGVLFTILVVAIMRKYPHYFFRRAKA
ncbi:MAG TPA: phosphatase PAP2 family protein [Flavipsychrobacter sp.]|nr:phosphatase PAP2 family protein [Flavipsychrobacter sp.]